MPAQQLLSLMQKISWLIELFALLVENTVFKRELAKIEQAHRELKENARVVLQASKETSIALKSKDIDNVIFALQNWNTTIQKTDNDLRLQFQTVDEQYKGI